MSWGASPIGASAGDDVVSIVSIFQLHWCFLVFIPVSFVVRRGFV